MINETYQAIGCNGMQWYSPAAAGLCYMQLVRSFRKVCLLSASCSGYFSDLTMLRFSLSLLIIRLILILHIQLQPLRIHLPVPLRIVETIPVLCK